MKTTSSLLILALLSFAALSGCVQTDGVSKDKASPSSSPVASSSGGPNSTAAPKNSTSPSSSAAPSSSPPASSSSPPAGPGSGVQHTRFKGKFVAADEGNTVTKTITVPANAKMIQVRSTWNDHIVGNSPLLTDIDLFLKNPAGKLQKAVETTDFEYIRLNTTANFTAAPGVWTIEILAYGVPVDTDWIVDAFVWLGTPTTKTFTGLVQGGVNAGSPVPSAGAPVASHKAAIPTGAVIVTARLTWAGNPTQLGGSCSQNQRVANDFDLIVKKGTSTTINSGNATACEFGFAYKAGVVQGDGSEWDFQVIPFAVTSANYLLTVEYA